MSAELPFWESPWAPYLTLNLAWPVVPPPRDRVAARMVRVVRALPCDSWVRRIVEEGAAAAGLTVDDLVAGDHGLVREVDLDGPALVRHLQRASERRWSGWPFVVVLAPRGVAVLHTHALGDATTSTALIADLLAAPDAPVRLGRQRRVTPAVVARAAVGRLLRSPRQVPDLLRVLAVEARERRRSGLPPATDPGRSTPGLVARVLDAGELEALATRRDGEAPDVSVSTMLLTVVTRHLLERVPRLAGARGVMLVGLRRHIAGSDAMAGTLVSHLAFDVDSSLDAGRLQRRLRDAESTGVPLVQYLIAHVRLALKSGRARSAGTISRFDPTVTWSHRGRMTPWDDLFTWEGEAKTDPHRRLLVGVSPPGGPRVSFHLLVVDGALTIAAVHDHVHVPGAAVAHALDAALVELGVDDPRGPSMAPSSVPARV